MSAEITGVDGTLPKGRIAVVASRYNPSICNALVDGALSTLAAAGFSGDNVPVIRVPGAWELALGVRQMFDEYDVIAAVALGAVIRGETTHDEHINRAVSLSLIQIGVDSGRPIGFGLLTCNTLEQAINRSGGTVGNKGIEAAEAVLEMLRLSDKVRHRGDPLGFRSK
jgi:6,7-dimethyl-8-ribityllumazine synthase